MLHAEPFETHLLSAELCVLFIYFLKGNCIGLEYHIILSKIHIIVIIKTKIIDQNESCSNTDVLFLSETLSKKQKLESIRILLKFDSCLSVDVVGRSGGLAVLWKGTANCRVLN